MSILSAGSFKTSDYRKAIPDWVKIVCAIRAMERNNMGPDDLDLIAWVRSLRMDHRPPLQDRDYDLDTKDFIPGQNDPDYIEAIPDRAHDERTFGTKATTLNSDAHNRAHGRRLRDKEAQHQLKLACKRGDPEAIAKLLHVEKPKRPKSRIPSRPFPKRQRPLRRA